MRQPSPPTSGQPNAIAFAVTGKARHENAHHAKRPAPCDAPDPDPDPDPDLDLDLDPDPDPDPDPDLDLDLDLDLDPYSCSAPSRVLAR